MNTIKDTKKIVTKQHELAFKAASHVSPVIDRSLSRTLADRAQKIVTAVYLITDLLSHDISLQKVIREKAVSSMQSLFDSHAETGDSVSLTRAQQYLYEMISYVDIAYRTGFITEMNYSVLLEVTHALQHDIYKEINKISYDTKHAKHDTEIPLHLIFADSKAEVKNDEKVKDTLSVENYTHPIASLSRTEKDETIIRANDSLVENKVSIKPEHREKKENVSNTKAAKTAKPESTVSAKSKRHENIIAILKQKKNASINDICSLFKDCSSKTIQRDLNAMIDKGIVMKRGDRRWSIYNLK